MLPSSFTKPKFAHNAQDQPGHREPFLWWNRSGKSKEKSVSRLKTSHPWIHQLVVWVIVVAIFLRCLFAAPGEFRWIFPVAFAAIAYYATAIWPWLFAGLGTAYMTFQSIWRPGVSTSSTISLLAVCLLSAVWGQHLRNQLIAEQVRSRRDPVTGLLNARGFEEILQEWILISRKEQHPFAVVYIDCDRFKTVNDEQGHQVGDALLKIVGEVLSQNVRQEDAAARLGGDEFAILMADMDEIQVLSLVEKLLANLRAQITNARTATTFSVGVVLFSEMAPDPLTCLSLADQAMYHVKRHGRDGIHVERYPQKIDTFES